MGSSGANAESHRHSFSIWALAQWIRGSRTESIDGVIRPRICDPAQTEMSPAWALIPEQGADGAVVHEDLVLVHFGGSALSGSCDVTAQMLPPGRRAGLFSTMWSESQEGGLAGIDPGLPSWTQL